MQPPHLSVAAAALFAAHAVHVEAVTNVTGRAELLAAVCFLGSVLLYPHGGGNGDGGESTGAFPDNR